MIVGQHNQKIYDKLFLAKEVEISLAEFKELLYSEVPVLVWSTKLDGTKMRREFTSVPGPSGNALYDYDAEGYFVADTDEGFRTIVGDNVTKAYSQGVYYKIK